MKPNTPETEPRWHSIGGTIIIIVDCFLLLAVGHGGLG